MRQLDARRLGHISEMELADAHIQDLAFQLLTIYYADAPIKRLLSKYKYDGIEDCFDEIKKDKIVLLLVQIATLHRIRHWSETKQTKVGVRDAEVGTLFIEGRDDDLALTMMEACNKVIHADRITLETRKVRRSGFRYFRDWIVIEGRKGKKCWVAHVNATLFCDSAMFGLDWEDVPF